MYFGTIIYFMEMIQNIVEYYDELYPITESLKKFFNKLSTGYHDPVKFLRVGCGAGLFEHLLAREGKDVTGIEHSPELLRSANLRRRNQLMSIRFFQMSILDMTRFLGKGFYNVIYSLDSRIVFIHDKTLMRKFFFDCRQLISENGTLVLTLHNFNQLSKGVNELPTRESVRTKLFSYISIQTDGQWVMDQEVETGNGKILPVLQKEEIYPLTPDEITLFAKEAGFSQVSLFSDFELSPFTGKEQSVLAVIQ